MRRTVIVSIIGADRFRAGYGTAKLAHEQAAVSGPVPQRILRAAQFHEFVGQLLDWGRQGDVVLGGSLGNKGEGVAVVPWDTYSVLTMALLDRLTGRAAYGVELAGAAWPQFLRPLLLELTAHRPIREVLPGVHHWTAIHPRIRLPVDSYYIEAARVVLDPMVPREGLEWFAQRETPNQIVLTNRHHLRHSERYTEAFGCPIRCSDAGLHEFEGGPKVEGFAFGEKLAPGITAHQLGAICPDDTALHIRIADGDTLAFADGLTRPRGGRLAFMPGFLMGDDPASVRAGLRESLRRLLDLDFDNLLFAHGEPLIGGGRAALREFVAGGSPQ